MDYNHIKTLFGSNEERYTPVVMEPIASLKCNCPMTIGGITHVNPTCRKYMPRRRTKVPAVFVLGDVKDQETDERMATESDRMSLWDL